MPKYDTTRIEHIEATDKMGGASSPLLATHDNGGFTVGNLPIYDSNGIFTDSGQTPGSGGGGGTYGSAVDATNGGANDLTEFTVLSGLSSPNRIEIVFNNISLNGTETIDVQIGDSGGFETTGYSSASMHHLDAGSFGMSTSSSSFILRVNDAGMVSAGRIVLTRLAGNLWVEDHSMYTFLSGVGTLLAVGAGFKTLSDTLTQVKMKSASSNTFDGGTVVGIYE